MCNSFFFITLQLDFSDVLAEPSAAIGFEWVWKLAFVVFSQTKSWFYKIFAALVAVPAALLWAVVFALVTVVYIWIVSPALRLLDLNLAIIKRVSFKILDDHTASNIYSQSYIFQVCTVN